MIELLKSQDVKDFGYFDIFSDQEVNRNSIIHKENLEKIFFRKGKRRLKKVFQLANLPSTLCKW